MKAYEIIEHTADIGLKIYGRNFQELLIHAAEGFYSLVTEFDDMKQLWQEGRLDRPASTMTFCLEAENRSDLFLKWLRELLFVFSTKQWIFFDFDCQLISETRLEILARGVHFSPRKDEQKTEVKAVTYHEFYLEKDKNGWHSQIIFDI